MFENFKKLDFEIRPRLLLAVVLLAPLLLLNLSTAYAYTEVGGPIISDTTWTLSNNPYIVIASVEVWEGVTLTIEPGVTVKFNSGNKLQINGELIAQGASNNPITFTSNQVNPTPGDWGNIEFTSTAITTAMDANGNYISGSILQYCVVEYAGGNADNAIYAHSLLINNCTIKNNDARGVYNPGSMNSPSIVSNSVIKYNNLVVSSYNLEDGYGGGAYVTNGIISNNTITNNTTKNSAFDFGAGGGIYADECAVNNNIIAENQIKNDGIGGGIYALNSTLNGNTVSSNLLEGGEGGGVNTRDSIISNNIVSSNQGGGIVTYNSSMDFNTITYNENIGIYSEGTYVTVTNNLIDRNNGQGIKIRTDISSIEKNTIINNSASFCGGGLYNEGGSTQIKDNFIGGNTAKFGGGYCNIAGDLLLQDNFIINNTATDSGGGIFLNVLSYPMVISNTIAGNLALNEGGGIFLIDNFHSGGFYFNNIVHNKVAGTGGYGAGIYINGTSNFMYNTVVGNVGLINPLASGMGIEGTPRVQFNNLFGNQLFDVTIMSSNEISGTNNYWGTSSSVDILATVYDWYDDSSLGKLLYIPYLQEPSQEAPFPPPFDLSSNLQNDTITLSWESLPSFASGWGFKIYYDTDDIFTPFDGTGLNEGISPIDVGNQTAITLTGLDPVENYYFAVTVYDNQGHESWYSNFIIKQGGYWIYLPLAVK